MLKKLKSNEMNLSQKGTSEVERMLAIMPKHCTCTACMTIKQEAKEKLGKSKYNMLMSQSSHIA